MQLDTEEGETFVPPAGVIASPTPEQTSTANDNSDNQDADGSESRSTTDQ